MTAEVAVANKLAVALAADSVATVGMGDKQKTHDTVNKLFTLSKFQPIGIMIYGNSEFMEFPWETLIKIYRNEKLGEKSFDTVLGYAYNFFEYLKQDLDISEDDSKRAVMRCVLDAIIKIHDDDVSEMEAKCDREIKRLEKSETILKSNLSRAIPVMGLYKEVINETIDICISKDSIDEQIRSKLVKLSRLSIVKKTFSSYMSGVVFAGFGRKEIFPTIVDFRLEGIFGGKLKIQRYGGFNADRRSGGFIKGYAQRDMVYRFMEGIDPDYSYFLEGLFLQQIIDKFTDIHSKYNKKSKSNTDKDKKEIIEESFSVLKEIEKQAQSYRREKFVQPILNMLNSMPKEGLANVAEALVSLTALRRKVSEETETVGGPVDVALISKGDGFVWIKRKHYFDLNLNQSFAGRYLMV